MGGALAGGESSVSGGASSAATTTGGAGETGGSVASGGAADTSVGGALPTGGASSTVSTSADTGGASVTGGASATGGASSSGGDTSTGGSASAGGEGGEGGSGGATDCAQDLADCNGSAADGCEVILKVDPNHCGTCWTVCPAAPHQTAVCSSGACGLGACNLAYADCNRLSADGCETDLIADAQNCGACGRVCTFASGTGICNAGNCKLVSCAADHYNIDGIESNGCEYACHIQSATDLPDDDFIDSNCDGIDGDVNAAIFVAPEGNDSLLLGTKEHPMATISAAIALAVSAGKTQVYASYGTYIGTVNLANGVSIYGGYVLANGWARSHTMTTVSRAQVASGSHLIGAVGKDITSPTTIDRIQIYASATLNGVYGDATLSAGVSNYGNTLTHAPGGARGDSDGNAGVAGASGPIL